MRQQLMQRSIVLLTLALAACTENSPDPIDIPTTGAVRGVAYIDRNGNGTLEANIDGPLQGIGVSVVPFGTTSGPTKATTDNLGTFAIKNLKVGDYAVSVDNASVPDSLRVSKIDSVRVTVTVRDTPSVLVALSFPTMTARAIRQQVSGKRVFLEGTTLNSWTTYGDSTLHVADSSGVLRITRVAQSNVTSGTRVRILGTTDVRDGQRTLTDGTVFVIASAAVPAAVPLTTDAASKADGGKLDAALVSISAATILGAQATPGNDFLLTVNDGSGTLDVLIDRNTGIGTGPYIPGAVLSATGILVPGTQPNQWQLKPRAVSDLNANFPTATVADVRVLELGKVVQVDATALTSYVTFGDATLHINDATGSLRVALANPNTSLFSGNRVRLVGAVGFRDGQPILTNANATVLGTGNLPVPEVLTTTRALSADGGRLDAALVKLLFVNVADTANIGGDFRLHVDDGSGKVEVLLDKDAGLPFSPFVPGTKLDITGVLVPIPNTTTWRLKPRVPADLVIK